VHFLPYFNVPLFLRMFRRGFTYLMARGIDRLIRREGIRFDLIHAHFTWPSGGAAVRLKAKYKVPVVVTEHTSIAFNEAIATKDPQFLGTWLASDAVIRVMDGDIDRMSAAGVPREKLHFIPNGFDDAKFRRIDQGDCRKRLGMPQDGKVIVSIGALLEVKGHKYLVDAMAEVLIARKDVTCYVIGDGELFDALTKRAQDKGLGDKVKFVGSKPHGELPYWINASDVVAHSSLSESGPMVMYEALGCGRPFVGTRVGSIPGVIASDDYGLVCEPGDPAALARNIVTALGRSWDADKIVAHSKQYATEWVSRELVELYAQLLAKD
jgi:glycosyltransferase involved in cell wall biosynthesis